MPNLFDKYQFNLNVRRTHDIYIAQNYTALYGFFMKKIITLMAIMLVYMLPALTTPAYAASHAKAADATMDADAKKKKAAEEKAAEEEDEEPECD